MEGLLSQIKKWWDERSFGQKFSLIFLVIALVGVLTYLFTVANQPDWDVLYSEMSPTTAEAVSSHLKEAGVPYKITNGGATILVPKDIKEQTRMDVAEAKIIKDEVVGLEETGNLPLGLTDSQQKLMKQRMIQGELIRTINSIKGIKNSRITVAEPERSIFAGQDEKPSASVMLILDPGINMQQEKVKAIKNLVSHAIPRLTEDQVFVSDQNGRVLSEELTNSSSTIDDLRTTFEKNIQKKVKEVLNKLVGDENVSVQVTAEMNFDKSSSKIERYIPNSSAEDGSSSGVLVSEQATGEKYAGQDAKGVGGTPGTDQNITNPSYATNAGGAKQSDYNKTSTTRNFEVSKETKDIVYAPGTIERLTVAVAINKILTTKEQQKIEQLVQTAAGSDPARGDVINVTGMSFADSEEQEAKKAAMTQQQQMDYYISLAEKFIPYILIVLFGGISLGILFTLIKRPIDVEQLDTQDETMDYEFPDSPELLEAASIPVIEAKLDPEIERMRLEINSFVMNDPSEAARLLLSYIKE